MTFVFDRAEMCREHSGFFLFGRSTERREDVCTICGQTENRRVVVRILQNKGIAGT
jgi:hypothetical protein